MRNTSLERLASTQAIMGAVIALLAIAGQARDLLAPITGWFLPAAYQPFVFPVLLIAAIALVLRALLLSRRIESRLVRAESLRLERDNQQHLVGRQNEIDRVVELAARSPLLFVVGESGVGKSALLGAGVAPKLAAGGSTLPVYIESLAGPDWEDDAWRLLFLALQRILSEAERAALGVGGLPAPARRGPLLASVRSATARTPFIIVDQFDDYQTRHWAKFQDNGSWVKCRDVIRNNSFWRVLAELAQEGKLHLAIVTRSDTALGLESIRFVEPETFTVPRLEKHFIGQLLDSITHAGLDGAPVIENPQAGWTELREKLIDDLGQTGAVLPQQLKISLLGLATLPQQILTIRAYERAGRSGGIEADWIRARIKRAEQAGGISERETLQLLLALIHPDNPRKTRDLSVEALAEAAEIRWSDGPALELTLAELESDEAIRRRRDPGEAGDLWRLDHDYLTSVVREAERRANAWTLRLEEGQAALTAASGNPIRSWNALLGPMIQLRFLRDRLRGRFRYDRYRAYALQSSLRFLPFLVVPLAIVAAVSAILYAGAEDVRLRNRAAVEALVGSFDADPAIKTSEISALLELAGVDAPTSEATLARFLSSATGISELHANLPALSRAMHWPSDEGRRRAAAGQIVEAMRRNAGDVPSLVKLAEILAATEDVLTPSQADYAADLLVRAMRANAASLPILFRLAEPFAALKAQLPPARAEEAATILVEAMRAGADLVSVTRAPERFGRLAEWLPDRQARDVAERLAQGMGGESILTVTDNAASIGRLRPRPHDPQAAAAAARVVEEMRRRRNDPSHLSYLARALVPLRRQLSDRQAADAATILVEELRRKIGDEEQQFYLTDGLAALGEVVPASQASEAAAILADAMRRDPDRYMTVGSPGTELEFAL